MARRNAALAEELDEEGDNEPQERTVREELEAARDEVNARHAEEDTQAGREDGKGQAPPAQDQAQPRGQGGKFASRKSQPGGGAEADGGKPAPAAAPAAPGAAPGAVGGAVPPGQPGQAPGAQPAVPAPGGPALAPQGWSAAAKAEWAKLPPVIQQQVAQREADIHRIVTSQDGERNLARQFGEVVNAYPDVIRAGGVHPLRYFKDVMDVMRILQTGSAPQRVAVLRQVAARNGIDFQQVAGTAPTPPPGGAPGQPGASPAASPLTLSMLPPEIRELPGVLRQIQMDREQEVFRQQQAAQAAQQRMAGEVMTEIQAFASKPESRFFDAVRDHMTVLLAGGGAETLEQAYRMAVADRPDIQAILDQERQAAAKAERDKAELARRARARGGSVRGGSGGDTSVGGKPVAERTRREELQAALEEVRARM